MNIHGSMYQMLSESVQLHPRDNAMLFSGKYVVYQELKDMVDRLANGLEAMGVGPGVVVTMALPNTFEAVVAFYAVNKLGGLCHMVHPLTPVKQMTRFLEETGSEMLFILDVMYGHYQDLLKEPGIRLILASAVQELGWLKRTLYRLMNRKRIPSSTALPDHAYPYASISRDGESETYPFKAETTQIYLHSGGTSGEPKTIELSSLAINALGLKADYILKEPNYRNCHMLAVLPMFHGFGLCMGIHAMLVLGAVSTLMPKFNASETIRLIKQNRLNYIIGVPSLYEALLQDPSFAGAHLKNLRQAFVGGDYVALDLKRRFDQVMVAHQSQARLCEGYGLTEVVSVASVNILQENNPHTVGKALPGIEIRTVDVESRDFLPVNTPGEIAIRGETMMNGYLNDDEANHKTFLMDSEGHRWLLTGDYGVVDSDGYVHFKQRLKRIVKVLGMPVMPSEIENLIMSLHEIKEVAAVGMPDLDKGSVIKLFIVLDAQKPRTYDDEGLKSFIKAELSVYAMPKEIVHLTELPKTPLGKVDTLKLEAM